MSADMQTIPDFEPIVLSAEKIADWSERLGYLYQDKEYLNRRIRDLERKIDAASFLFRVMTEEAAKSCAAQASDPQQTKGSQGASQDKL